MRMFTTLIVVLAAGICIFGCSKKQAAMEEQQQEPASLTNLSSEPALPEQPAGVPASGQAAAITGAKTEPPLPPSGPYKPTALEIQTALKNAGLYLGALDGKMGPKTKKAVEEFQTAHNLKPDGKVGSQTWGILRGYLNPAPGQEGKKAKKR